MSQATQRSLGLNLTGKGKLGRIEIFGNTVLIPTGECNSKKIQVLSTPKKTAFSDLKRFRRDPEANQFPLQCCLEKRQDPRQTKLSSSDKLLQ